MKKILSIVLAILMLSSVLTGCGGETETTTSGKDSVVIALNADISTFDPFMTGSQPDMRVTYNIYDTLVDCDDNEEVVPLVAESWEISEDGLTYTFHIKQGIKFHNGDELTANDVAFSLLRGKESPFKKSIMSCIDTAVATDNYTCVVTLEQVTAPFLLNMAKACTIFNEKVVTEMGEEAYSLNPVGSGAYKLANYSIGEKIELEAFDEYHLGTPKIKNVTYKILTDANSAVIALETGEVDVCNYVPISNLAELRNNENLTVTDLPAIEVNYLTMNEEKEPFNNPTFRQALAYAVDRQAIIDIAKEGLADPAYSILTEYYFGFTDDIPKYDYNPDKARELLAECGYKDGVDIGYLKTYTANSRVAETVQSNFKDVGIICEIELVEFNAYYADLGNGNYDIGATMIQFQGDASRSDLCYHSRNINGLNRARYNNPVVDELYLKAASTMDRQERLDYYKEIFTITAEDCVYIPICTNPLSMVTTKGLTIGEINPGRKTKAFSMEWTD